MLDRSHLISGLEALSRAHRADYFADGHRGAALIAATYLCHREDMEPAAARRVADLAGEVWAPNALFAPLPKEAPAADLLGQVVAALTASTDCLRQAGHNVIFPALALRALADVPEAITPTRVAGLVRLVEAITPYPDALTGEMVALPPLADAEALAEFVLHEALAAMGRFAGRGQGWTGHLLTHAQAVMDLGAGGHVAAAEAARHALAVYLQRVRMGPLAGDRTIAEHPLATHGPLTERYWASRPASTVGLGHCFKYPYAFYALLDRARDRALIRRCNAEAYRVL